MERKSVTSSNIKSIGYSAHLKVLEVEFASGHIYRYENVPEEEHEKLMNAASVGSHHAVHIKNNYKFTKI